MQTRALVAQANAESRMMLRRREVVFFSILLPAMFMFLFGSIFGDQTDPTGIKIVNYMLPGYMVMAVMSVAFISLGIMTANERQNSVLKRLGATPLPRALLLLGKLAAIALVVAAAIAVLLAIGMGFYGISVKGSPLDMVLVLLLGIAVFAMIGLMVGGMVKAEAAPAILNAVYFPFLFLGGALVPVAALPDWLQQLAKLLPSYHFNNALIAVMVNGQPLTGSWANLLALAAWGLAALAVASRTFKWE